MLTVKDLQETIETWHAVTKLCSVPSMAIPCATEAEMLARLLRLISGEKPGDIVHIEHLRPNGVSIDRVRILVRRGLDWHEVARDLPPLPWMSAFMGK